MACQTQLVKRKIIQKYLANAIGYPRTMVIKLFHTMITGRTVFCSKRPDNLKKRQHKTVYETIQCKERWACVVCVCKTLISFTARSQTINRKQRTLHVAQSWDQFPASKAGLFISIFNRGSCHNHSIF